SKAQLVCNVFPLPNPSSSAVSGNITIKNHATWPRVFSAVTIINVLLRSRLFLKYENIIHECNNSETLGSSAAY
uniref:Uncharacterized protein n=1 Tax=Scophthalmus maximus TaxID=52904 RepID=A0A8D3ANL8_SCOMX